MRIWALRESAACRKRDRIKTTTVGKETRGEGTQHIPKWKRGKEEGVGPKRDRMGPNPWTRLPSDILGFVHCNRDTDDLILEYSYSSALFFFFGGKSTCLYVPLLIKEGKKKIDVQFSHKNY